MAEVEVIDPRDRFSRGVEAYVRYRPDYPMELVDWVLDEARLRAGDLVVDLGCGTGITSRRFAGSGMSVIGVDANDAMLAAARRANGAIPYVRARAEELPLGDAVARAAIAGQSFHWFDLDRTLVELSRILAPDSPCFAFWNIREDSTPFLRAYDGLLGEWCPDYPVASADDTVARLRSHPAVREPRERAFAQNQRFDKDGLLGRAWSSSYVVHGVKDVDGFHAALERLFDTYQEDGTIDFRYRTVALAFVPAVNGSAR